MANGFTLKGIIFALISTLSGAYAMDDVAKYNANQLRPIIEHAKSIAQKNNGVIPSFIAMAGCSAVGKSYFSIELAHLLEQEGIKVAILKGDDFLNPDHFDPDYFHPRLEHALMHSVIQKIKSGENNVRKPTWNPKELRPPSKIEENFSVQGIALVLFEGEFTLCDDKPYDFRNYCEFGIFIDAEEDDIIEWNWNRKRDIAETTWDEFVANNKPYLQKYRSYVHSSRESAQYLVLKDKNHRYTLQIKK